MAAVQVVGNHKAQRVVSSVFLNLRIDPGHLARARVGEASTNSAKVFSNLATSPAHARGGTQAGRGGF
jgi:hypothetical protein